MRKCVFSLFNEVANGQVTHKVRLADDSTYEAGMCCNGGHYGMWRTFERLPCGDWLVGYGTTSEFGCCPDCGQYVSDWHRHECQPQVISPEEFFELLCSVDWEEEARYFDGNAFTLFDETEKKVIF